jgi:FixJ family two-component response regulator
MVYVVDNDKFTLRTLERLFYSIGLPVKSFACAQDYLEYPVNDGPSCLVLDVRMPGLDGLELQRALTTRTTEIVFITSHDDVPKCLQAILAGAMDFLTKPVDEILLISAVSRALERSNNLRKTNTERAIARSKLNQLTPREFEVMQQVLLGALNKQIAAELGAAVKTVKIHRGRVMRKMGVPSVAELVRVAQIAGVTPSAVA